MTDLVAQLVGALEDCLDDSRQALADMEQIYSDSYRPWRLVSQRKTIADAEAALTAAKAGGWVAVPVEPTDEMLAAGKKQAHSNNSVGAKCLRIYAAMLAARPLPAPPAQRGEG